MIISNYLSVCDYLAMSLGCNFLNIFKILLFSVEFAIFHNFLVAVFQLFNSSKFLSIFRFFIVVY